MQKLTLLGALALALTACGGGSSPQPQGEPVLKVAVNPASPQVNQKIVLNVSLMGGSGTWNMALFNENPDGSIDQIYPNRLPDGQPTLTPGATLNFPPPNAKYFAVAVAPAGIHTLLAYASQTPLDLEGAGISRYENAQSQFATVASQGVGTLSGPFLAKLRSLRPGIAGVGSYEVVAQPAPAP
ncbi:DUF4384 domain-containing protein [Deinococcus arenicola]|uniref:DUF4384 domain-containing protein n=1 Tax=Deinococcus arenicola TaxID=2994950 RepID=A0ABU4DU90_9DEIO|nr:DUF4384 domain-containing protein [Deinococcus sp. ZS9-10]MDV6375659.1 DUF4384 domain-containing protein [Deinococcus sp. ZS9-10]